MESTVIYIDKQRAMSFVIKALYFHKEGSTLHWAFQKMMNYEEVLFTDVKKYTDPLIRKQVEESDSEAVKSIQKATILATFDYRIYEEIK